MNDFMQNQFPAQLPVLRHERDGIFIRQNDYFRKYLYRDILYVKACGCYCDLYFRDKKRITVAQPLGMLVQQLPGDLFVRLHHSYVISLYDIGVWAGNSVRIGEEWIPIGYRYRAEFLSRLNILSAPRKFTSSTESGMENI